MRLSVSGGTATGESTRNDSLDSLTRMMPGSPGDFKVAAAWTVDDPHVLGKFVKPGGPTRVQASARRTALPDGTARIFASQKRY
jgi:hypothetical protein